jgi:hypothetical protein
MKKRFSTIFTITVAAVLVSSIAYAAKKKLQTKSNPMAPDVSEVDLAADLLDAKGDHKHKTPKVSDTKRPGNEELKDLTTVYITKN